MGERTIAFWNFILRPFGKKMIVVGFQRWKSPGAPIGEPYLYKTGPIEWPARMSNMEFFARKNGLDLG